MPGGSPGLVRNGLCPLLHLKGMGVVGDCEAVWPYMRGLALTRLLRPLVRAFSFSSRVLYSSSTWLGFRTVQL